MKSSRSPVRGSATETSDWAKGRDSSSTRDNPELIEEVRTHPYRPRNDPEGHLMPEPTADEAVESGDRRILAKA